MEKELVTDQVFNGVDFVKKSPKGGDFENCQFVNCSFAGVDLSDTSFTECEFEACDFSSSKITNTGFKDVFFNECKLIGLRFEMCNTFLLNFSFENCQLNYSTFYKLKLPKTVFKNCSLLEADFTETNLMGSVFTNCDLSRAVFLNANLEKADLRTAKNFDIDPENNSLSKARFSRNDLSGLLEKHKLIIE